MDNHSMETVWITSLWRTVTSSPYPEFTTRSCY